MRRSIGVGVVATVLFAVAAALVLHSAGAARAAAGEHESGFLTLVNQERAARGLGGLVAADDLVAVGRRHSARMAARNQVFHNSNLSSEVEGWELLGETVGVGPTVREIHDALMASRVHRDVILQPRFTQLGVGVVMAGGEIWVTEVFRLPEAQPQESPDTTTTAGPPADPADRPATTTPTTRPVVVAAGPGDPEGTVGAGGTAEAAPAVAPEAPKAAAAPVARRGGLMMAGRTAQVAGWRGAPPPPAEAPAPAPAPEEVPAGALPVAPAGGPVVVAGSTTEAIDVPLPEPAEIPVVGLVAAGLLLVVVGSASASARRAVAPS